MAEPGAVVDVGCLEHCPGELLHQVVLLIGDTGRCKAGGLLALVFLEVLDDDLVGLVPAGLNELAILFDEWLGQPVRSIDELPGIVALGAELALVDRVTVPGLDADNLFVLDNKVESAPGSAIRTRGWYVLEFHVLTSNKNGLLRPYLRLLKKCKKMMNIGGLMSSEIQN